MSTTQFEHEDLRGIRVVWALAAALLASGCGGGSSRPVTLQSGGSVTTYALNGLVAGLTGCVANGVSTAKVNNVVVTCPDEVYTLGGTISGLTRTGLALANGANIVSVAANTTSFKLPTPVAYANSYAVTVATQPAGLTCSVSNGSGLMPARNVTGVSVKCSENTYTIGATASDVNAKGLVLFLGLARSARSSRF